MLSYRLLTRIVLAKWYSVGMRTKNVLYFYLGSPVEKENELSNHKNVDRAIFPRKRRFSRPERTRDSYGGRVFVFLFVPNSVRSGLVVKRAFDKPFVRGRNERGPKRSQRTTCFSYVSGFSALSRLERVSIWMIFRGFPSDFRLGRFFANAVHGFLKTQRVNTFFALLSLNFTFTTIKLMTLYSFFK